MKSELETNEMLLRRNLSDIGCHTETIDSFLKLQQSGDMGRAIAILKKIRRALLEKIHTEQRRIDCLDFLLHDLNRNTTSAKGIKK